MRHLLTRIAGAAGTLLRDLIGLAGAAAIAYGAWLAWAPAGWMVAGLLALTGVWLQARGGR